jgi:hypothetical protein
MGFTDRPRPIDRSKIRAKIKLPSVINSCVTKRDLIQAIQDVFQSDVPVGSAKRHCVCHLDAGGALAERAIEEVKVPQGWVQNFLEFILIPATRWSL